MSNIKYYTEIIKAPILTEVSIKLVDKENKYTFKCDPKANRSEIAKAIEYLFKVQVLNVNTSNYAKKAHKVGQYAGFKPAYKKAIVELAKGSRINAFTV